MEQVSKFLLLDKLPNVLKHPIWREFLKMHGDNGTSSKQEDLYRCTYKRTPIYRVGSYYFCFKISKGYRNLTALKRLL